MLKTRAAIVIGILILIALYLLFQRNGKKDDSERLRSTLTKLRHNLAVLGERDTVWNKTVNKIRDSLKKERASVAFWRDKYKEPITVTKTEIRQVFEQDSATITKEIKRGLICDSLQRNQFLEIGTLNNALAATDSVLNIKKLEIKNLVKIDSTHLKIESNLKTKLRKRTAVEVALGALAVLLLIFGK